MIARLFLAVVFAGLGGVAWLYASATSPSTSLQEAGAVLFPWTAAETACLAEPDACDGAALIAQVEAAPLSHRPFTARLAQAVSSVDADHKTEIAALVLARDPRSVFARLVLGEAALQAGDQATFLSLFLPLLDLDIPQRAAYADVLASVSDDAEFRADLAARLQQTPGWGSAYLAALIKRGGLPAGALIPLLRHVPAVQSQFLSRLTKQGSWDVAYVAFSEFVSTPTGEEPLALTVPFNPDFRDHPAPAPFNWSVTARGAQRQATGGVYAFYEGRKAETILVQSFPLAPGAYKLETEMSGEATETGGYFRWQLACATGGAPFEQIDVRTLKAAPAREDFAFEMPTGQCTFVTLSLRGVPGAFPRPARIEVRAVHLSRDMTAEVVP